MSRTTRTRSLAALSIVFSLMHLNGCGDAAIQGASSSDRDVVAPPLAQVSLGFRSVTTLSIDGYLFKDMNRNGRLDPYEDWRLPTSDRVLNLLSQMTLEEKVGMMLIDTLNAGYGGVAEEKTTRYIKTEKMTRFVFRNAVVPDPGPKPERVNPWAGANISVREAASFLNTAQEIAETTRLGIPLLFKSNPRNHVDPDPRFGISAAAGSFSAWPKGQGLAAIGDLKLIEEFADTVRQEWTAMGVRGMYGYTIDLATEPRWTRVHETFSEDAQWVADIATALVKGLQGEKLDAHSVALTMKHFPGGGPQLRGADPHYAFGKDQVYPAGQFDYHVIPFKAAIDAGTAAIMPYYGIPVGQDHQPNDVGMAFSKGILTGLLRQQLGFEGVVNSDTGIITDRAWGLEDTSVAERLVIAIEAGTDVLSGFHENAQLLELVTSGQLSETRVDESVRRLLAVQFNLGLFEDPYVDVDNAVATVGRRDFVEKALEAQRRSIVLLKNDNKLLPLQHGGQSARPVVYALGFDDLDANPTHPNLTIVNGSQGEERLPVPEGTSAAIIKIIVNNDGADKALRFGGANEDELDLLSFSAMAEAKSWKIKPGLEQIKTVMAEVGAEKTVLAVYFRQPYVLDSASQLLNAGAILATFGVTNDALLAVVDGSQNPGGKLPFALANKLEAIIEQAPDAPGYAAEDTLYPNGWGMEYPR